MASIYDKASLVMIPSGSKEGKLYSQKPVSGDGDFTFSRSTAATRVNADGNIEKETQNLFTYSNTFDNAAWSKSNVILTSGHAGYDGTNNAYKLIQNTTSGYHYIQQAVNAGLYTWSIYAKAGEYSNIGFYNKNLNDLNVVSSFNLSTGTWTQKNHDEAVATSVGNGWYRISIPSRTSTSDSYRYYVNQSLMTTETGDGTSGIYIQSAQIEQGLVARDYIETTTTAVEGGITDNVPRLDYTDSSCPALLLEPQRTNLSLQSEYFDVAPSVKDASTIEVNGTTSPSGLDDACLFTETTANDRHGFYQYITISAGALTASIFTKEIDRRYVHFQSDATGSGASSYVDLQDGSVVSEGSGWSLSTEDYGNGWYRIKATCTAVAGNKYFIWGVSQNGTSNTYAGSTSSDFTFYGFQVEAGSYATSYIPTYGSAVTRNVDLCKNATPELGDSQGTLFLEFNALDNYADAYSYFALSDKTYNNRIAIINSIGGTNQVRAFAFVGGTRYFDFFVSVTDITSNTKVALTYKENDFAIYVNGVKEATDTSGSIFPDGTLNDVSFTEVGNNASPFTGNIRQALVFPTALTDQEAIDLTTID